MSVEVLQMVAMVFYISAGVFCGIVLILFFRFRIWRIMGDLSGINAKREIRAISKKERAMESHSQGILGMKPIQKEKTESFVYKEDTQILEGELVKGKYCLIEKMEYIGSAEWIE